MSLGEGQMQHHVLCYRIMSYFMNHELISSCHLYIQSTLLRLQPSCQIAQQMQAGCSTILLLEVQQAGLLGTGPC